MVHSSARARDIAACSHSRRAVIQSRRFREGESVMMLGLSLAAFTMVHVVISLAAIAAGLVVMFGLLGSKSMPGLTAIILAFTILTSATGFLFPFEKLLPSHVVGFFL